jgi:phage tail protein X
MQHLVHQRGPGGIDIQRPDAAAQRQRDQRVAARRDARSETVALGAEHEHDAAAVVGLIVGNRTLVDSGPVAPAALALRVGEEVGKISRARNPKVLDRTS